MRPTTCTRYDASTHASQPAARRQSPAPIDEAISRLKKFVEDRRLVKKPGSDFERFEAQLHERVMDLEREILQEDMARADVDAAAIVVDGVTFRRVCRAEETYITAAGKVRVERALFKDHADPTARAIVPMELQLGIIEGLWTPHAARQGAWVVAHMTPQLGEELFARVGNMAPSKSSLDRLAKKLGANAEADRKEIDEALRETTVIPAGATSVMVSIDGVLAPMKDTDPVGTRAKTAAQGQIAKGPAGYREVGCATLSFCDSSGKMLSAIRCARMPETKKATLKRWLTAELEAIRARRPDLKLGAVADGAADNWTFLSALVPDGPQLVDFFHAAEHLNAALAAVYGDGTVEARRRFNDLRHVLLEEQSGVASIIRALDYLRRKHPRVRRVATELAYFRKHKKRMSYAELREAGYAIGSGVVEAACKTLVAQRMKQSGMRWGQEGGQAILTLRGWAQSERFDQAWALLAATYRAEITLLNNVVPFRKHTG